MEKLKSDEQKEIVNSIVAELAKKNSELYYTDSSTIANLIYEKIHNPDFSKSKFEKVGELSRDDILILMSYNTTCC